MQVSNITDAGYLGTRQTLTLLSPLLQPPSQSPHGTLIALYLNAIGQIIKTGGEKEGAPNTKVLMQYIPLTFDNMSLSPQGAYSLQVLGLKHFALDKEKKEKYFERQVSVT